MVIVTVIVVSPICRSSAANTACPKVKAMNQNLGYRVPLQQEHETWFHITLNMLWYSVTVFMLLLDRRVLVLYLVRTGTWPLSTS